MTTIGKYRHLAQSSTPAGHFNILAIDHRANLLENLNQHAAVPLSDAEFTSFKQKVIKYLAPLATAVLADPDYGFGPGIANSSIAGQIGFLSPLEITDYRTHPSQRVTNFIPNWSVEKIKRAGASGVKLLLYYHPGAPNAQNQRDIVARVVEECRRYDIPLFLEPIAYSLDPEKQLENSELRQVVIEGAKTFSHMGVDILKVEFPLDVKRESDETVWQTALVELNAACAVPWSLLSGGVDYPTFKKQCQLACAAGASGVIVGRAVWGEAVTLQGDAREQFLADEGAKRMRELGDICRDLAKPWRENIDPPEVRIGWYEKY